MKIDKRLSQEYNNLNMKNKDLAKVFKILGDESRLKIVFSLFNKTLNASDLLKMLKIEQSTLSHHMKLLLSSKIVTSKRKGKFIYYSLNKNLMNYLSFILKEGEFNI